MAKEPKSILFTSLSVVRKMLLFFLPSFTAVLLLTVYIYNVQVSADIYQKQDHELHDIAVSKVYITYQFKSVIEDLGYLTKIIQELEKTPNPDFDKKFNQVKNNIKYFADTCRDYDQIRYIENRGYEKIRVNNSNKGAYIVKDKDLQYKGDRYYFKDAVKNGNKSIYFSPFDLNIEHGKIEVPFKPMIRIAKKIYNGSEFKGIVIINYLGRYLIDSFNKVVKEKDASMMLLNKDSYWLIGERPEDEWGFMFDDKKDLNFKKRYSDAWQKIAKTDHGQFESDKGLFTYTTIFPLYDNVKNIGEGEGLNSLERGFYWKIVSFLPVSKYLLLKNLWYYGSIFFCILAFSTILYVSWRLAWLSDVKKNNEKSLKRARDDLEIRVLERTRELMESYEKLKTEIDSRHKAEQSLIESEKQYRMLVETMNEGLIVIDKEGYISYANDQLLKMLKYDKKYFFKKHFSQFLDEENLNKFEEQRKKIRLRGALPYEIAWKKSDNSSLSTHVSPVLIKDDKGNVTGSFGIVSDITQRKKYEKTIKQNRDRINALFKLSSMEDRSPRELSLFALEQSVKLTGSTGGYFHFYGEDSKNILLTSWSEKVLEECESAEGTHYPLEKAGIWADSIREKRPVIHNDFQNEAGKQGYPEGHFHVKRHMSVPVFDGEKIIAIAGLGNKENDYDESDIEQLTLLMAETWRIITKKKAKEELSESEKKYRTLYETMDQGVIYQDTEGRIISANRAAERILGVSFEMMQHYIDSFNNDVKDEEGNLVKRELSPTKLAIKTGKLVRNSVLSLPNAKTKHKVWIQIDAIPQLNEKKEVDSVIAIFRDITETRKSQRELKASEEKHRSMMEAMDDPVYICTPDYVITYMNPAMKRWLGGDYVGNLCYRMIYDREDNCPWCSFDDIFEGKNTKYTILNPKDNRHYNVSNSPIKNADGSVSKFTTFRDITETLNLEKQLRHVQKLEAIGTLAGGIAHDFNNILSAIIGFSEISLMSLNENERVYHDIREVMKAGYRAKDLVQQILTFSRQTEQEMKPVRISYIIKETLKLLKASLPATIKIEQVITSKSYVMGDVTQIHQVIMNLCTNGAHSMDEVGGKLKVELYDQSFDREFTSKFINMPPGEYICLRISDDGKGIAKENLERIFEPFFTSKPEGKGTGLGLSLVHGIVKNHKGQIQVESNPGEGSVFTVYWPVMDFESEFKIPSNQLNSSYGGNEKILVVDDEEKIIEISRRQLSGQGYIVEAFVSPLKALETFKKEPDSFDLIITDMTMPDMTGDLFTEKILEIRANIPVVICSGFSEKLNQMDLIKMGASKILMKPVMKDELLKTVRDILDQYGKGEEDHSLSG